MASYYYLVATLPSLRYDGVLPFTTDTFLSLCKDQVSKAHYLLLEQAVSGVASSHRFQSGTIRSCRGFLLLFGGNVTFLTV